MFIRKKFFLFIFIFSIFIFSSGFTMAENTVFLENLPGMEKLESAVVSGINGGNPGTALQLYVNWAIQVSVVLGSILAVGVIILGGIKYMTTDSFSGKTEGREHLTNAIMGLIFLIGGYLIFEQVNPNILNISFSKTQVEIDFTAGSEGMNIEVDPSQSAGAKNLLKSGHKYIGSYEKLKDANAAVKKNGNATTPIWDRNTSKYEVYERPPKTEGDCSTGNCASAI